MADNSIYVQLARQSLNYFLQHRSVMPVPADIPPSLKAQAGVFVSLKKKGQLRGCIGTFLPVQASIAAEVITNVVSAGTEDPRFSPVTPAELAELDISVDVLAPPEAVNSLDELDPQKYGVIVRRGHRSGLLLPMLDGVDTVEEQVGIAMQKAGIAPGEEIDLYRFTVHRYT
ncbi:ammecr1 [Lucifera butyrica]|uniref:Ammecr1 n=1 Tax=Lucifera butyrica TaxID=1351585 RepID=A0A498QXJ3_9FIRM|nr:AmmeMemoRadiSam system protein A [Lucifera butyrica]VBB04876.1 ammecr1 [Lucifera butyrica]